MKVGIVSQYTEVYCDCGARARLDSIAIQCPAKPRYSRGWAAGALVRGAGRADGRAGQARGARGKRVGVALGGAGSRGAQALGRRRAQGRGSGEQGARGAQTAGGRRLGASARGRERAGRERAGRERAGRERQSPAGARAGFGQCTRCTRPVFGPVRLVIFRSQIFGHCS